MPNSLVTDRCAYCGSTLEQLTDDHVLPRGLFMNVPNPVIVPACLNCNGQKARDDEYLRDMFVVREETYSMPEMELVRANALRSAARPNRNPPIKTLLRDVATRDLKTSSGLLLGRGYTTQAEANRYIRALLWIRRGLHFAWYGQVLSGQTSALVWGYNGYENKIRFDLLWDTLRSDPVSIGPNFQCRITMPLEGRPDVASWGLVFFQRVFVLLNTNEDTWSSAHQPQMATIDEIFRTKPQGRRNSEVLLA